MAPKKKLKSSMLKFKKKKGDAKGNNHPPSWTGLKQGDFHSFFNSDKISTFNKPKKSVGIK